MDEQVLDLGGRQVRLSDLAQVEVLPGTNPLRVLARLHDGSILQLEGPDAETLANAFDVTPPITAPEVQPVRPPDWVGQEEKMGMPSEPLPNEEI